ncbi:MAG: bifunctional phosphopantothenoylcysteine decarboxylase/phosphopantothenate synthase [Novosphingobium sp.]|nr:bifunctional phosphopantothenoylcysteine decarboxylase/phosphopantothenate synthase [Novosphingobium sp.]
MTGPRILLVVGGGIAAYKTCELVRTIRRQGGEVTCVLTEAGAQFVTPMALAALSENPVYTTLWDLRNESEMGHIRLSREADLVVVCPATANLLAKMASGIADDLATTLLLATDKPVMVIPAMNVRMWRHEATVRNVETLRNAGVDVMEPDEGPMACGEFGPGRLPDPEMIWQRIAWALGMDPVEVAPLPGAEAMPQVTYLPPEPEEGIAEETSDGTGYEDAASADSKGFSGLSASLIARGRKMAQDAIALLDPSRAGDDRQKLPEGAALTSLLPRKGEARSAPPTDPEALNHLVSGNSLPPEPLAGSSSHAGMSDGGYAPIPLDLTGLPLHGRHVLVTAGPTWEAIDPVRYIANRSSGRQGYAIAAAAARAGARVTLVSGPVTLPTPPGVRRIDVESALEMAEAVHKALPADIAVMVAAVADWRTVSVAREKIKKRGSAPPALLLTENPDILANLAGMPQRPKLLIGFAAETEDVIRHAKEKRKRKGADWIIANDVSGGVMGGEVNAIHIITARDVESLPEMPKDEVARILVERMADAINR